MDINGLFKLLGIGGQQQPQQQRPQPRPAQPQQGGLYEGPRGYQDQRPFKMYEDQSFQGNPGIGKAFNPGYTFYEDNSFAPPKQILPQQPQHRAFQQPNLDDFLGRFR